MISNIDDIVELISKNINTTTNIYSNNTIKKYIQSSPKLVADLQCIVDHNITLNITNNVNQGNSGETLPNYDNNGKLQALKININIADITDKIISADTDQTQPYPSESLNPLEVVVGLIAHEAGHMR